jgi:hypothetical protein
MRKGHIMTARIDFEFAFGGYDIWEAFGEVVDAIVKNLRCFFVNHIAVEILGGIASG